DKLKAAGLHEGDLRVKRSRVGCFAACKGGPVVCVQPDGTWYYNVTPGHMDRIVTEHLVGGRVVQELVFHQGPSGAAL
ncbi:MAG: (2Fe-2S) ferredoxin domain-containing protein, partial [Giesbergeria sp.]|nr:(2Fe-2S) ferredoxin domain-containing protein [Giesbergeria sp.]